MHLAHFFGAPVARPIFHQRGHPPALAWFVQLTELPCVPGYVVMELVQDARNNREVDAALKLVAPLPVVWPSADDCTRAPL